MRALQLLGEPVRVGGCDDAFPDQPAGLLVVAVTGGEGRREADVDLRLRLADDPGHPAQRLLLVPEVLRQRRALVVEEVDPVEVEDVDGAGSVVRDAVLVLAAQTEVGAELVADRVAAAFTARHLDHATLHAVPLMPDPAGPDDAGVIVGMGPLPHHVDLRLPISHIRLGHTRRCDRHRQHSNQSKDDEPHESLHVHTPKAVEALADPVLRPHTQARNRYRVASGKAAATERAVTGALDDARLAAAACR